MQSKCSRRSDSTGRGGAASSIMIQTGGHQTARSRVRKMAGRDSIERELEDLEEAALEGAVELLEEPLRAVERFEVNAWADLRAFTLWGERALIAGRVTLGIIAAVLLAHWLGLEMPVWAAISVLRVFQNDKNATLQRGLERIAGTVAGGLIAYAIMLARSPSMRRR
ncbi:MAG: hypothetical protein B7Y84_12545 [Azorhizobium sp. 32-67-21]|nr:MAG: hypothetical protein B7Y84_12545 [Azorhizobium sp. 32-67-21]